MKPTIPNDRTAIPEFLSGGGELGQLIREFDWSKTSLGPVESWPQSLRTCIRIMLTSRQPIWIGWGKDLIKFYNDPYKAIVGGKHPWALGKPASVVWKDIWKDIDPLLRQVMEEDQGIYVESQLLIMERNGYPEETYYTFSYTPIPGDDGRTAGMFCANTEDTDRIISERQLKTLTQLGQSLSECHNNEEVIHRTIETLKDNTWDFPFALFRTIRDNKAILSHSTNMGAAQSLVKEELDLEADNTIARTVKLAFETAEMQVLEDVPGRVGNLPTGAWNTAPQKAIVLPVIPSATKKPFGVLVVGLNPYRELDEKYRSFFSLVADQVATAFADVHLLEEERKRVEALAEIDRAKTIFFSNISHEFRTPLTLLLGPIEEALDDPDSPPAHLEKMDLAYRNALRMQKLVNTLLEFSRIEAGRAEGRFAKVDICAFTRDLASTFRSAVEKAGMELHFSCNVQSDVYVDTDMWEKIVLNLISNAFKYSRDGSIHVEVIEENGMISFSVADTGVGIPADQLDKIFDRFHRVENITGRSGEGTGIGLAMVKELVKLHQGQITVKSEEGKGSVFTVVIPAGKDHLPATRIVGELSSTTVSKAADAFVQEALKWVPQDGANGMPANLRTEAEADGKPTVLLADDNADMRDYVQRLLAADFNVITAADGEEAFHKLVSHQPALVLSDIMMPKLDGFGLLKKIRQHPKYRNIPLIFLSARAGEEAKVEGLEAGADDYLVKPFSGKELLVRVHNHIRINEVRAQTEGQFYQMFLQAPAIINVFRGPEHQYELYHPLNKELFDGRDFTGMKIKEALPELEGQGIFEMLDEVYHEGRTVRELERLVRFNTDKGEPADRYFNFTYQPWKDKNGRVQGVLNFAIEVTDMVKARKAIEESETYFRQLADSVPAILWITEKDGYCSYLNRSWYDTTGQAKEEALGFGWLSATHPDDAESVGKAFINANEKQIPFRAVYRLRQRSGEYRWAIDGGTPRFDREGNYIGFIGSVVDVHESKIAEEKIRESEEQFRTLTETLPQLVWMTDAKGKQVYTSSRWKEYAGVDASTNSWEDIVYPYDLPNITEAWQRSLSTGEDYRAEVRLRSETGAYRWFFVQGVPIRTEEGEISKWIGSFTDIQDQKEIEGRLEALVRERTEELQRSNSDLQQFAHVASHDLKEPLRKIKTFTGRLTDDPETSFSEKAEGYISKINTASDRMFQMIEGVLNYSTMNVTERNSEVVALNSVMQNIESDLELLISQKSARLEYKNLPALEGAPVLIYQLFYNLVNNSLKFARRDVAPVITISCDSETVEGVPYLRIVLTDNGIGFEPEFSEKIFETFIRLNSKDKFEGTGLGLSLCKRIAERHGGSIQASGTPGEGAVFTILLPEHQGRQTI